jgi:hypothetical protein
MKSLHLPTSTSRKILLGRKRHVGHVNVLSFARKLRMLWVVHSHVASPATASSVSLALQCWRAQCRQRSLLGLLVHIAYPCVSVVR